MYQELTFALREVDSMLFGTRSEIECAIREHPAPPHCSYARERYQFVSSLGGIPFLDVPNGVPCPSRKAWPFTRSSTPQPSRSAMQAPRVAPRFSVDPLSMRTLNA